MSVNYNTSVLNSRLQDVVNALGAGGVMRLRDSGGSILASFPLPNPAGTVGGGVLTFTTALTDPAAAGAGTAVAASFEDSTGTTVISGITVGTAADSELILSPTNIITAGKVIVITAASITGS